MKQFIIEVLSGRNAKKATRYTFPNSKKITVGRSYGCDIIIDDPYVSAQHLKVSAKDGLLIEDLNSENGTLYKKEKVQNKDLSIQSGDDIHIGHTEIKVFAHDHEIKPTKKINWANHLRGFLTHPIVAIFIYLLTCVNDVFNEWLFYDDLDFFEKKVYEDSISISLGLVVLAIIIHSVSLSSKHKIKFTAALSYVSLLFLSITTVGLLVSTTFASSLNLYYTMALEGSAQALVVSASILFITYLENGKIMMKEYAIALFVITAIPFFAFYSHMFPDNDEKLKAHYETSVPIFAWEPNKAISIESFLENNDHIFEVERD